MKYREFRKYVMIIIKTTKMTKLDEIYNQFDII